jgi:hypothetical protein
MGFRRVGQCAVIEIVHVNKRSHHSIHFGYDSTDLSIENLPVLAALH